MAVRDVTRRERPDEETDHQVTENGGKSEPPADRTRERCSEQDDADLENRDSLGHIRRLPGGGTTSGATPAATAAALAAKLAARRRARERS
jgi:hypothetical protein